MTDVPLPEPLATPSACRTLCLGSSDFGEGDVLAEKYPIEAVPGESGIVLCATHPQLARRVALNWMRPPSSVVPMGCTKPTTARSPGGDRASNVALGRVTNAPHSAWDPESIGREALSLP